MSATGKKPDEVGIDQLQSQLRNIIDGKKYLLVFDDVWNEDRNKWRELEKLLKVGSMGNKILVTTRSWEVAKIVGTTTRYDLEVLSEEKSWSLFERVAFKPGQQLHPNLVKVGKEIVKKCANVPLAIVTLGSLLYDQEESKWLPFMENELHKIAESGNDIIPILKISYHHLRSPLKKCFVYCSLFPKDYEMDKEALIYLWMAEGFIIPSYEGQSLEDAGEMYFLTLLQRCFFQDITKDKWGDIRSCKMHDLMHDLAREVAGTETIVAKLGMETFDNKRAHHLSIGYPLSSESEVPTSCFELKSLRTFLLPKQEWIAKCSKSICPQIFSSFRCLRVLDLHKLGIESLPSSIGHLVHLRYLDLSSTYIKTLPASITELQNLQTLKLRWCNKLEILPMDIRKLINLRHLDVGGCDNLTCMPVGIGTLTNIHKLNYFLVGSKSSTTNSRRMGAQLRDLNTLVELRGKLHIKILGELRDPINEAKEENLRSICTGLTELELEWNEDDYVKDYVQKHDEDVLDGLQPNPDLRRLEIRCYRGQRLPIWPSMDNLNSSFPNLVVVSLENWKWCQNVPMFHRLPSLKSLTLRYLGSVEYMESSNYKPASSTLFFPSLEELTLEGMDKLKGWWNIEVEAAETCSVGEEAPISCISSIKWWQQQKQLPSFPRLRRLEIYECPNLKSMPLCPNVEELYLLGVNKELVVLTYSMASPIEYSTAASTSSSFHESSSRLKHLYFDDVNNILSLLAAGCLQNISSLTIQDPMLPDLSALGPSLSSLQSLKIKDCHGLRSLSGGLEHLSSLKSMQIRNCSELDLSAEGMEVDMPWKALKGIRSLVLWGIPKMVELPDGLQHLTTLRSLRISFSDGLIALPEWIRCLTSLESFDMWSCPGVKSLPEGFRLLTSLKVLRIRGSEVLRERCRDPNGDDWPKIQHIPSVDVRPGT
ncbi:hypothetical protein Dimus_039355 [Dionaea muscipula]